jgi:Malectin domain
VGLTPMVSSEVETGKIEAEKEELAWLLTSGVLGRSNNLARMLRFICEKHFDGQEDLIKEHTIAVEALGRRNDFDPQIDTIVRVTAHSLRKRLHEVYQKEGTKRPVHIFIPSGHYVPSFIHCETYSEAADAELNTADPFDLMLSDTPPHQIAELSVPPKNDRPRWLFAAFIAVLAGAVFMVKHYALDTPPHQAPQAGLSASKDPIRALIGSGRKPYADHSGNTWAPTSYCTGGNSVTLPDQKIVGTEDPYLYLGGLRGIVHCTFPVKPGLYEIHLHFAETSDLPPATRRSVISVNAASDVGFDVVDNAGGDGIATSHVWTGIAPENDGAIHVDFVSEVSPLNAVEILPAPGEELIPVRIVAGSRAYIDSEKQVWLSDRYFNGGRRGQLSDSAKPSEFGLYGSDRIGTFRYTIPVIPHEKYRVRLFFRESWFGKQNGASGGPGSRVFNVYSNGALVLRNFDILAEAGSSPVVKTFDDVEATSQGKIELSFVPVVNYPLVNAIEVVPEPEK